MELTLPEIKAIAFEILKHFKRFCNDNGIKFFLSNGTLLGAVKYGGFIPWDDDVDVFVPRVDYDRLMKLYKDDDRYRLFSSEREPKYRFPFAKLCDMTTMKEEANVNNGIPLGIEIDIFPLDACTEHMRLPKVQRKHRAYQLGCMLAKFKSSKGKSFYKQAIINLCRACGYHFFCKRLTNLVRKESVLGATFSGCLIWPIYGAREIVPTEVFSRVVQLSFEGEQFPAPKGYDTYLRSLYGDYWQDPPPEKQKSHHNFKAYRL